MAGLTYGNQVLSLGDSMAQLGYSMGAPVGAPMGIPNTNPAMINNALPANTMPAADMGLGSAMSITAPQVGGPAAGGGKSFLGALGGWNMDTAKLALGGLQTLGNLWMGAKALKMAKEQFNYQKGVTETNLVNSIQSYNTALADRAGNRGDANNAPQSSVDEYINKNKAVRQ